MKLFDLTHSINPNMPVYPSDEPPVFKAGSSIDESGFKDKLLTMGSHTGTHIDAPAHLIKGSATLDLLPIERFYGNAFLLNLADSRNREIELNEIKSHGKIFKKIEFLLIDTGWSQYWGNEKYFSDYRVLSLETAHWLNRFGLKGIGLDTISVDEFDTQDFPIHKAFLEKDTLIIENLTHLDKLPCNQFIFSCFPLSLEDADGSPVRAVAYVK